MDEHYWQFPKAFYVPLILLASAALTTLIASLELRCARWLWLKGRPGRVASWGLSLPLFLVAVVCLQAAMFAIMFALQAMGLYDSCMVGPRIS